MLTVALRSAVTSALGAPGQHGARRRQVSMIFLASVQDSLSVMFLIPMSEGLSLMVTGEGVGVGVGEGTTVVADSDEMEDAGTREPAMDDMTDVPLEGRTKAEEPHVAVRDEPC